MRSRQPRWPQRAQDCHRYDRDWKRGYGFGLRHNRGVLTPYTGLELGDDASRTGRAGLRWSYGSDTTVRLEATQNASNGEAGETQLRLEAGIRF